MKTFMAKSEDLQRKWYVIDASNKPLGRLASEVAKILRGKNKPIFTPHVDTGDHVIVLNAAKVLLTGNKLQGKIYEHHTQHPGGLKEVTAKQMLEKDPEKMIELAVKGMLPKNSMGRAMFRKLKVYKGAEHDHQAQKPETLELNF